MKISPVLVSPLINKNSKINRTFKPSFYGSDVFVKTKKPKTARDFTFEENYKNFEQELAQSVFSSEEYDFNELKEIIKKYCPEVSVHNSNEDNYEYEIALKNKNCYLQNFTLAQKEDSITVEFNKRRMFLKVPEKWDKENKVSFFETMLHEAIHMFQDYSSDREGRDVFYKKAVANQKYINLLIHLLNELNRTWRSLQVDMSSKIMAVLKNSNYSSNEINRQTVSLLFDENSEETLKEYSRSIYNQFLEKNKETINLIGRELVLDDFISELNDEAEAYEKSNRTLSKYFDIDEMFGNYTASFELVRAEIYKEIARVATKEKNKKRPIEKALKFLKLK